ncbi:hypothetical protein HNP89_001911 [Methanococcus maripaludis]|uniref:Uncharacterized protein n=1 Tax=Methanococcus maripaludis TaxID=39152 RepID=A0A7J9P3H5_METMI|nr:MIT C-terminal domain-containing protein [Methanococcus maripaludis]MBA2853933.1 hypothetical protein [Methanococcus maripaludis]
MKLPVVVCPSFLEFYFTHDAEDDDISIKIESEFRRRRFIMSNEILIYYDNYFSNSLFKDVYSQYLTKKMQMKNGFFENIDPCENEKIKNLPLDDNLKSLLYACCSLDPSILLSEKFDDILHILNSLNILKLNYQKLFDRNEDHILNQYRLPILRERIKLGQPNEEVSKWLKPFFKGQKNITVVDPHIFSSADDQYGFENYILPLIDRTANIKIITYCENKHHARHFKNVLKNSCYMGRNMSIYGYNNNKLQHDREIFTDDYHIELGHGIAMFGRDGQTRQSNVNIKRIEDIRRTELPKHSFIA